MSTVPNGAAHLGDQSGKPTPGDQRGDQHVVPGQPGQSGQSMTSMDVFGVAQTLEKKSRHECVLPIMLCSSGMMYTLGEAPQNSLACMQQGLFAVGAACHSKAQLADVVAYMAEDSLFGPYVQQMGQDCVYNTLLRSFNSCQY